MKKESFLEIILNKKISRTITSILIGTIFVVFGVLKAANISQFADYFLNFNISKIYYLASILVALEIAIGFCFLFQFYLKSVSMFTFVLVAFFSLIIVYNYIFLGINDCGCGGGFLKMPIELSLLRNGIILIFTSYLSRVSVNAFDKIKFLIIFLFFSLSWAKLGCSLVFKFRCLSLINPFLSCSIITSLSIVNKVPILKSLLSKSAF